jgi:cytochrome c556
MKRIALALAVAAAAGGAFAAAAVADETNPYIVHRQGIYKVAGGHMTALKAILALNHPEAQGQIAYHANALKAAFGNHANPYAAGSEKGETKAKPEIWSKNGDFKAAGKKAGEAVGKLVEAANGSDRAAVLAAFKGVGEACKGCHDNFRKD